MSPLERLPDSHPSGMDPMFCVPEWDQKGVAYAVRTRGFKRRDTDVFYVIVGGSGHPYAGPLATEEEAHEIVASINGAREA